MHSFWRCPSARCSWSCRQCGGMCWSPRPDPRHVASFLPDVFWDDVLHRRHHNDNIEIHPIFVPPQINAYFNSMMIWFLVTFIKLYSTWGWGWDKKYFTPICNNIKFPAAITGRTPSPCWSQSNQEKQILAEFSFFFTLFFHISWKVPNKLQT